MTKLDEHLAIKKFSSSNLKHVFELGFDTYGEEETTPLDSKKFAQRNLLRRN